MRSTLALTLASFLILAGNSAHADETAAKSRIVAVGLFKNGLAVIKREATLGGSGSYVLDDVPEPVHGTFWIESVAPIESVVRMREVEVPAEKAAPGNLQEDLAGKKVTIHFKGGKLPPANGTVMKLNPPKRDDARSRDMAMRYGYDLGTQPARFLVLQTAKGRAYLEASEIAYVEAEGADEKVKRRQPRLLLTVGDTDKAQNKVFISYLTRGLSWAASYRVDITDPKTLTLEQHAVIKNELADLDGAEIKLISGFPSVQFAHVTSPLAARTSLAQFFQELNQRGWRQVDGTSNTVAQQVAYNTTSPVALSLGATPAGEGVDVHYQSIGKRTLADGDALELTVARGKSAYERIVEWLVPDTRNEYGQHIGPQYGRGDDPDQGHDTAWDALKFKNPFDFPMTTGPATVTADGKFNGQRTSYWVNAGEETVLHVNKALSVRTRAIEHEEQKNGADGRDFIWIGGRQFRRSTVEGELSVCNHRNESIKLVIRRRFSGELVHADGEPKSSLREEGVYSVNKRNELLWTLPLKPGEERKLTYRYTVLVAH
jgi:hypothetical protein